MRASVVVAGILPGLAYFIAMMCGLVLGIKGPANFLVITLLAPAWSDLVMYALVLGGSVLSAALSLGTEDKQPVRMSCTRIMGWSAIVLLFINTPMSIFQIHRLLTRQM